MAVNGQQKKITVGIHLTYLAHTWFSAFPTIFDALLEHILSLFFGGGDMKLLDHIDCLDAVT
jgi:hypothetical protein